MDVALSEYVKTARRGVDGWCQRVLYCHIKRWHVACFWLYLDAEFVEMIRTRKRKEECGPECEVWFGGNRRLEQEEMVRELERMCRDMRHKDWPENRTRVYESAYMKERVMLHSGEH